MVADEKIGQATTKFDNVIDNIFKFVSGMNIQKGKNILATYDQTQLQPITGRLFSGAPLCYYMLQNYSHKNSVCAQDDNF